MAVADCNVPAVNRRVRGRSLPWITLAIKEKKRDYPLECFAELGRFDQLL